MNKKFMMPFGFVLMLVMATAVSPAEASIKDTFKDTRVNVDPLRGCLKSRYDSREG